MSLEDKQNTIAEYLKSIDVRSMEFYEEIKDHILSSYEQRTNLEQSLNEHIEQNIEPEFGGKKGIKRIQEAQHKLRNKLLGRRFLAIARDYLFSWPYAAYTLSIGIGIWFANQVFLPKHVMLTILILGAFVPVILATQGLLSFYLSCKKSQVSYHVSDLNQRLFFYATLGTTGVNVLLNFLGLIVFGSQKAALEFWTDYPLLQVLILTLMSIYVLVYLKIHREKFIYKNLNTYTK